MSLPIFQVDVFTSALFKGNPAAVVLLTTWPNAATMQKIAAENNLAETAFVVPKGEAFEIRWFTPKAEVDLCGHATLASAFVIFETLGFKLPQIIFKTCKSGDLAVTKTNDGYELDFPLDALVPIETFDETLWKGIGVKPLAVYKGKTDYLFVYNTKETIQNLQPDFALLTLVNARGIIVTAPGDTVDFVSRFFAPNIGIDEDPVTGSAHTTLLPYWHKYLGKSAYTALQLSERGGNLNCAVRNNRALIAGKACLYLKGEIFIPE